MSRASARRPLAATLAALLALALLGGCASKPRPGSARAERDAERKRTVILTSSDEVRVGREASESVEAEIGTLDDPALQAYVEGIGKKLLRALPYREFAYRFAIVDQMEPNAFALPGGYIYVSRGLLALVNSEDELACVLAHEIAHVARSHAAQRQSVVRSLPVLQMPWNRAAEVAAYGRDMEREADEIGQRLAAAVGYDPMGMSTFMRRLDQRERLLIGAPRAPTFYDTHPGTRERATASAIRSRELRWTRDPAIGDPRRALLEKIEGMVIGDRPETGVFVEELFLHPVLGFELRFPKGWPVQNTSKAVGARTPRGDAVVFLTADMPPGELVERADGFVEELGKEMRVEVREKRRVKLGAIDAVRYSLVGSAGGLGIDVHATFFPWRDATWRIEGAHVSAAGSRYMPQILLTTRSFGPIAPENLERIRVDRLQVVLARAGEDVARLGERTGNAWSPAETALINGQLGNEVFAGGEWIKILRRERYEAR